MYWYIKAIENHFSKNSIHYNLILLRNIMIYEIIDIKYPPDGSSTMYSDIAATAKATLVAGRNRRFVSTIMGERQEKKLYALHISYK